MRTFKAILDNGRVTLLGPPGLSGKHEAVVVVSDEWDTGADEELMENEQWKKILCDPTARPAFNAFMQEAEQEIASGQTRPMDPDSL